MTLVSRRDRRERITVNVASSGASYVNQLARDNNASSSLYCLNAS